MEYSKQTKGYWNKSAKGFSESIQKALEGNAPDIWSNLILQNAPEKEKLKILDVGCGPGFFSVILSLKGHDVTGIDVTPGMIDEARTNAQAAGAKPELLLRDVHDTGFADDTFDLIVSRNVTWTLYEPEKAYAEWKRILKVGGRILIFDGNWYMHNFNRDMNKMMYDGIKKYREKYDDLPVRSTMFQYEDYWRILPMVGRQRPLWDRAQLWKMKMREILYNENINDFLEHDDISEYLYKNTPMFMIRATKASPAEELEDDIRLHFNGAAPVYGVEAVQSLSNGNEVYKFIKYILPVEGKQIIDAGCGAGMITALLSRDGYDVTGIDFTERMAVEAEYTLKKASVEAKVICEDLKKMSIKDGYADAVILKDVLWCVTEPEKIIQECKRVLKPQGLLIISDYDRYSSASDEEKQKYTDKWYPVSSSSLKFLYGVGDRRASLIDNIYKKLPFSLIPRLEWDRKISAESGLKTSEPIIIPENKHNPETVISVFTK